MPTRAPFRIHRRVESNPLLTCARFGMNRVGFNHSGTSRFRRVPPALLLLLVSALVLTTAGARADKLSNLVDVVGARPNQLIGYGVVTGLDGSGDDVSAPFAQQSLTSLLRRLGVQIDTRQLRLRNVAAVTITATIPAFARPGSRIDVTVSSIGNARSLRGGVLLQSPLRGADRNTYAVAQGPLVLGGFTAKGASGSGVSANVNNSARIPNGAIVERAVPSTMLQKGAVVLSLRQPDFIMAERVSNALGQLLGQDVVRALDGGAVELKATGDYKNDPVGLIAKISDLEIEASIPARVIINERTGTIVAGGDVKLLPVAIAQGGITIAIRETPLVSQPGPLSLGNTAIVNETEIEAEEKTTTLAFVNGAASLADVAQALATFGVSPRELASILQALSATGALRAEVIVQ